MGNGIVILPNNKYFKTLLIYTITVPITFTFIYVPILFATYKYVLYNYVSITIIK